MQNALTDLIYNFPVIAGYIIIIGLILVPCLILQFIITLLNLISSVGLPKRPLHK